MQINQAVAAITALSITTTISVFAFGLSSVDLEQYFAYDIVGLIVKVLLACAMVSAMFIARPRNQLHRLTLGVVASGALLYATYGAITDTLLLGDAVIFFFGAFIAMTESLETSLAHRRIAKRRKQIIIRQLSRRYSIPVVPGA